ncbi:MAG TPA: CdaR family protein [Dehalococcoidia bacterium]
MDQKRSNGYIARVREARRFLTEGGRTGVRSLRSNSPLMLLSLGLAIVLWAFVTNQENPSLRKDVSFQVSSFDPVNVPKGMLVTRETPNDITVTLIGPRTAVNDVRTEDIQINVDLSGADSNVPGGGAVVYTAPVKASVKQRGGGRVRAQLDPTDVRVTLEPVVRRSVSVRINSTDAPPIGFELESQPVADPSEATVSGLRQNVDAVDAVYADLKLTGLSVSTTVALPLSARSSDGRAISGVTVQPSTASIKVAIKRTVFNREVFVSVQTHGKPAVGYQEVEAHSDPPSVTIAGSLDTLNNVTTIPTDDVEIEGATQDVKRVVGLKPPPGVTVVSSRTVAATITIAPGRGQGQMLVAPRVIGLAAGVTAQISTTALVVTFAGPQPQLLALKPADVTATVDVSGLAPGTYSLDPKIGLPQGIDKDSVTPAKVDLVIVSSGSPSTPAR